MRILFTADPEIAVPPVLYGGIQRIVDSLLVGIKARGHEVGLVANSESTSPAHFFSSFPGTLSQKSTDIVLNTKALMRAVREFNPDLIHSFSRLLYLLPVLTSSKPKIMSYQRLPSRRQVSWGARLGGKSLTFTGCSEHISVTGRAAGGTWQTVYNFVDLSKFKFQPTVLPDAPLLFLSAIQRIKGAHIAISAAKRAKRQLLIAGNHSGNEDDAKYWQEDILPYIGRDGIEYIGPVNDEQKNNLLGTAAAMVVPIQSREAFGIVFAESLACGTPVIACPIGAAPEIVRPGMDGFLINTVEEACDAFERLPQIDRNTCRQRVEDCFSSEKIVAKYEQLYRLLIMQTKVNNTH